MQAVLSRSQLQKADTQTLGEEGISSFALMERACDAFVACFMRHIRPNSGFMVHILCGTGNNGGDGLCIARRLQKAHYSCKAWRIGKDENAREERQEAQRLLAKEGEGSVLLENTQALKEAVLSHAPTKKLVLIDALFGIGLTRPLKGEVAQMIHAINAQKEGIYCVSVDMPSGLMMDKHPCPDDAVMHADWVISLGAPKLALYLPSHAPYVKAVEEVPIGLSSRYLERLQADAYISEKCDIVQVSRGRFVHKHRMGRGLLVAGHQGMYGAALLAAHAALRSGIGVLYTHIPKNASNLMHTYMPEALVQADREETLITDIPLFNNRIQAIGIGCGIGRQFPTAVAMKKLLKKYQGPCVIDADGLYLLAHYPDIRQQLPKNQTILTPHEGELRMLIGPWKDDYEKLEKSRAFVEKYALTLLIKGAHSIICHPKMPFIINSTGHPCLATAGSGDVLTGLILCLLSQGIPTHKAAQSGAYLHGKAAEIAIQHKTAILARDLCETLPLALYNLQPPPQTNKK